MYYLELSEPVSKTYTHGFKSTTVSGSYLMASAINYQLGAPTSSFEVRLGKMEFDESGSALNLKVIIRDFIKLTSDELTNWGTDDFDALKAIATHLDLPPVASSGSSDQLLFTL